MAITINGSGTLAGLTGPEGLTDVISDGIFIKNVATVTSNITLAGGTYNYGSFGPIDIQTGTTVTIGTGATWSIV